MGNYYQHQNGLGSTSSYRVSGKPFASGGYSVTQATVIKVEFPSVTRWVQVSNPSTHPLRVGFSENGIGANNYFIVEGGTVGPLLELKLTEIYLRADTVNAADPVSVSAGLTSIASGSIISNWSGSAGVG